MSTVEDQIQEVVDRETRAWDTQDVESLISLVLNAFDHSFGLEDWKNLNNPDLKKIVYSHDTQFWDKEFELKFEYSNNFH